MKVMWFMNFENGVNMKHQEDVGVFIRPSSEAAVQSQEEST